MANGIVTEYNMWSIISDRNGTHHGASRRLRKKRIKKSDIEWFTTFVDEFDEDIVKAGMTKAIKRYAKGDLYLGLVDYDFWKRYAGLSEERCNAINRALIDLVVSGKYLDKEYTIRKIMSAGKIDKDRAELIAITELSNLANVVRSIAYRNRTKVQKFKLVTEDDEKVCKKCRRVAKVTRNGVSLEELKRIIKEIGGDTARDFILHPRCYTEGHLVLAYDGWKRWDDVKEGEYIWSVNPKTLEMELARVVRKIKYWYSGYVYDMRCVGFSMEVTKDHEMWVSRDGTELVSSTVDNMGGKILRIPDWCGIKMDNMNVCGLDMSVNDYIDFMAWYLSEGCSYYSDNMSYIKIYQENKKKKEKIYELAERIFSEYAKVYKSKRGIRIDGKNILDFVRYLASFGKSYEKRVPNEIKLMTSKEIDRFLYVYSLGDGCLSDRPEIFTTSVRMVSDLVELAMKAGYHVAVDKIGNCGDVVRSGEYEIKRNHDLYRVRLKIGKWTNVNNLKIEKKWYNGYVYDVELDRNHVLCVMRDGKVAWSGNCRCAIVRANEDKRYMRWWE